MSIRHNKIYSANPGTENKILVVKIRDRFYSRPMIFKKVTILGTGFSDRKFVYKFTSIVLDQVAVESRLFIKQLHLVWNQMSQMDMT